MNKYKWGGVLGMLFGFLGLIVAIWDFNPKLALTLAVIGLFIIIACSLMDSLS